MPESDVASHLVPDVIVRVAAAHGWTLQECIREVLQQQQQLYAELLQQPPFSQDVLSIVEFECEQIEWELDQAI